MKNGTWPSPPLRLRPLRLSEIGGASGLSAGTIQCRSGDSCGNRADGGRGRRDLSAASTARINSSFARCASLSRIAAASGSVRFETGIQQRPYCSVARRVFALADAVAELADRLAQIAVEQADGIRRVEMRRLSSLRTLSSSRRSHSRLRSAASWRDFSSSTVSSTRSRAVHGSLFSSSGENSCWYSGWRRLPCSSRAVESISRSLFRRCLASAAVATASFSAFARASKQSAHFGCRLRRSSRRAATSLSSIPVKRLPSAVRLP